LLARSAGWPFRDLDSDIAAREGRPVADLIVDHGESDFRERETAALARCGGLERAVIATGGGAFTLERNRRLIGRLGRSVWIDPPWDVLCQRAQRSRRRRPLFESPAQARPLYDRRLDAHPPAGIRVPPSGAARAPAVPARVATRPGLK